MVRIKSLRDLRKKIRMYEYEIRFNVTLIMKLQVEIFSLQIMHTTNIFTTKTFDMNSSFLAKVIRTLFMKFLQSVDLLTLSRSVLRLL